MALVADRGSRRNLGTGKSLSFVSLPNEAVTLVQTFCNRALVACIGYLRLRALGALLVWIKRC